MREFFSPGTMDGETGTSADGLEEVFLETAIEGAPLTDNSSIYNLNNVLVELVSYRFY